VLQRIRTSRAAELSRYVASLVAPMQSTYDIFVSYSSDDEKLVDGLVRLMGLTGRSVFLDKNSIEPGALWEDSLRGAISASQQMVLLWCCHSSNSEWVGAEIQQAVDQEKTIVPLLLCDEPVPEPVAKYQWIDFRDVVAHPCDHTDIEANVVTVNPRYIMPEHPYVYGMTYWDTLYSPDEYLAISLGRHAGALTAAQSMTRESRALCAAVFRALELQWAEDTRLGP